MAWLRDTLDSALLVAGLARRVASRQVVRHAAVRGWMRFGAPLEFRRFLRDG
jgi:hypothetical protein